MNSISEDVKFSVNPSKPCSEYEDSLTSKLDKDLHTSDEVDGSQLVNPSHDASEVKDLGSKEEKGKNRSQKRKSVGSYASLGTVIRHETPNIKLKSQSKRQAKALRVSSSRNSYLEKEIWLFFKKLVKKNPELKQVVSKDKDFEDFFQKKFSEFEEMLQDNLDSGLDLKKAKTSLKNKEKSQKSEKIQAKLQDEELARVKKSFKKFENNCKARLKQLIDENLKKFQVLKNVEDNRLENEKTARVRQQKQTIIENIRNYYDDKIRIFKEKLNERKTSKALLDFEHKVVFSEARRERFRESRVRHQKSLENIYLKVQKMKLEMEDETVSIQEKIMKLYKNSAKSIKSCNFR